MFNAVLERIGLKFTADRPPLRRDLMSLRHTYICFRLMDRVGIWDIAANCRTSVAMIEAHYARWLNPLLANINAGPLRKFGTEDNKGGKGEGKGGKGGKGDPAEPKPDKLTLALLDASEEERIAICKAKAVKAAAGVKAVTDEVMKMLKARKSTKPWSKNFQEGCEMAFDRLSTHDKLLTSINTGGAHGNKGSEYIKTVVMEAARQCKLAQEFMKDVNRYCDNFSTDDAKSIAGSKRSRGR